MFSSCTGLKHKKVDRSVAQEQRSAAHAAQHSRAAPQPGPAQTAASPPTCVSSPQVPLLNVRPKPNQLLKRRHLWRNRYSQEQVLSGSDPLQERLHPAAVAAQRSTPACTPMPTALPHSPHTHPAVHGGVVQWRAPQVVSRIQIVLQVHLCGRQQANGSNEAEVGCAEAV